MYKQQKRLLRLNFTKRHIKKTYYNEYNTINS